MAALFTIVTRTFGARASFIRAAARSVFGQTYRPIEWIVVQDGPGDAGETLATLTPPSDVVVRHIVLPKRGRSVAANAGLDAATGDVVNFFDDDDELFPNHAEVLVGLLERHPLAAGAYAAAYETDRASTPDYIGPLRESVFLRCSCSTADLLKTNLFPIQAVAFRRTARFHQRFDHNLDALEDWLFWIELFLEKKLVWSPEVTSRHFVPAEAEKKLERLSAHRDADAYFSTQSAAFLKERGLWKYGALMESLGGKLVACYEEAERLAHAERAGLGSSARTGMWKA